MTQEGMVLACSVWF